MENEGNLSRIKKRVRRGYLVAALGLSMVGISDVAPKIYENYAINNLGSAPKIEYVNPIEKEFFESGKLEKIAFEKEIKNSKESEDYFEKSSEIYRNSDLASKGLFYKGLISFIFGISYSTRKKKY